MAGMRASEEMILKLLFLDRCSSSVHDLIKVENNGGENANIVDFFEDVET